MAEATGRRVLVIDDDDDIRRVLTRYLGERGHEVRSAENGREGLMLARVWSPHIILLDLEMPEMSGLDVLRHLTADHTGIPVVALSGHAAADWLGNDARRLGAHEFFAKPFDLEHVGTVVKQLLGDSGD